MSLFTILGLIFVILKLLGDITWSWWIVLCPFYPVVTILLLLGLAFAYGWKWS